MSKNMFQKLETQKELNLIKESVDLSQDIIFSDVLKDTREALVVEENFTSYRDYYKTMYHDFSQEKKDRKEEDKERKQEEEKAEKERKAADEKREKEEKQIEYNNEYEMIVANYENRVNAEYEKARDAHDELDDKISAAIKDQPADKVDAISKEIMKKHDHQIAIFEYNIDRIMANTKRELNNLNFKTPSYVHKRTDAELKHLKPDLRRFKKGGK